MHCRVSGWAVERLLEECEKDGYHDGGFDGFAKDDEEYGTEKTWTVIFADAVVLRWSLWGDGTD